MSEYHQNRYREDSDFREKVKATSNAWYKDPKNKERIRLKGKKLRNTKKLKGLCLNCSCIAIKPISSSYCPECAIKNIFRQNNVNPPIEEIIRGAAYLKSVAKGEIKCGCCHKTLVFGVDRFCLDHDHLRNKFRDILCETCNTALGFIEKHIQNAIPYLLKHGSLKSDVTRKIRRKGIPTPVLI